MLKYGYELMNLKINCVSKALSYLFETNISHPLEWVLGQLPPRQLPPKTITTRTIATHDKYHPDDCHPFFYRGLVYKKS